VTGPAAGATPELIAHRGDARRHPENTLIAIAAALEAGARYVEFDVQMTADGEPVIFHDDDLRRTAGVDGRVTASTLEQVRGLDVGERSRFGDRFAGTRPPTVAEAATLLAAWPDVRAFVEIKPASIERFGAARVVDETMRRLEPVRSRAIAISFDPTALRHARRGGAAGIGWVLDAWNDDTRRAAETLAPEYIFCDHRRLPADGAPVWDGPWHWAVYEVDRPAHARQLAARGIRFVETMAIAAMLEALSA
jgi:glycerophosphoryl diester phosphodiesterase